VLTAVNKWAVKQEYLIQQTVKPVLQTVDTVAVAEFIVTLTQQVRADQE
jgi:hypothetical protein